MTSRVSFPKLFIETLRRHTAAIFITILTFIIHIISVFLIIQNTLDLQVISDSMLPNVDVSNVENIVEQLTEISAPSLLNALIGLFLGGYLAFDFFKYLHSKRQVDLYESMPVKREKHFLVLLLSSLACFVIPCLLTTGIEIGIYLGTGLSTTVMIQNMLWNMVCMIGAFLAGWATTALAMIMTGHTVIAALGVAVLSAYFPIIVQYLFPAYAQKYFMTYVFKVSNSLNYLSPASLVYKASYNWSMWNLKEHWTYMLGCFVFGIVISIIAYLLFTKRPSEAAGRAMAFERANPYIRVLIVIPIALYAGLFLSEVSAFGSTVWMLFGIIFVGWLMHGIMECIFNFDIKALFSKKRQFALTALFCLVFVFVFWIDLFQYDSYMPKAENVKSIILDSHLFAHDKYDEMIEMDGLSGEYVDDALLAIQEIIEHSDINTDEPNVSYISSFTVTYKLKNGTTRQRAYNYYADELSDTLDKLYCTEAFKDDYILLYQYKNKDIPRIKIHNGMETTPLNLDANQIKELRDVYLAELTSSSFKKTSTEVALYELIFELPREGYDYNMEPSYPVYSSFTKTLELLKQYPVTRFTDNPNFVPINMEIFRKFESSLPQYISNKEQLNALKPYMIPSDFLNFNYNDQYEYCDLRYELNGETGYMNVYIKSEYIKDVLSRQ